MAAEGGGAVNTASMQVSTKVEDAFQVIIIGDSGVGKTSIILRFAKDQFYENTSDAGYVSDFVKEVTVSGRTVKLHVWDTAGLVSTPRSSLLRLYSAIAIRYCYFSVYHELCTCLQGSGVVDHLIVGSTLSFLYQPQPCNVATVQY